MNAKIKNRKNPTIDAELETLQRESFCYFLHETNPANGLVKGQDRGRLASQHRGHWLRLGGIPSGDRTWIHLACRCGGADAGDAAVFLEQSARPRT